MKKSEKDLLEEWDLMLLHAENRREAPAEEDMPKLQIPDCGEDVRRDIWSRALGALSGNGKNAEELRTLHSEIMKSPLPAEALRWWEALFAVALGAPPEELGRMAAKSGHVPDGIGPECISAAAAKIAHRAWEKEMRERRENAEEENRRLMELHRQAELAQEAGMKAKRDLEAHRRQGGGGS